jgi:hypothetical protein
VPSPVHDRSDSAPNRRRVPLGALALLGVLAAIPLAAAALRGEADAQVSKYPRISGGEWQRGPNLTDAQGRAQPRQEHAAVEFNGFVYLIGGFVPIQPPPPPTANEPEPFPFAGTGDVLAYTPVGHPTAPGNQEGRWSTLPAPSAFPMPDMHHLNAVAHRQRIWAFGGHSGPFDPTGHVFVFTPASADAPHGVWSRVRVRDGRPCGRGERCLRLPVARAAGAAVSVGSRIYLIGGVVPYANSPDPVNQSIRTTRSVIYLDTARFPLRWRRAPRLRQPREHFNAAVVGRRIWVFHGRNEVSTHMRGVESMAPGDSSWRREEPAPVGTSANILAAVGTCVYSFGGEFIASNTSGTLRASQVFDVRSRSWSRLRTTVHDQPLDAAGADSKHGTYGIAMRENGRTRIMAAGGAATAWFDPTSEVHVFTPPRRC